VLELETTVAKLLKDMAANPAAGAAVAVPLLRLAGVTLGGWLQARAACRAADRLSDERADRRFLKGKLESARFYAEQILPQAAGLTLIVRSGAGSVLDSDPTLL
jgi:butyryl-CoA dehydrogenase